MKRDTRTAHERRILVMKIGILATIGAIVLLLVSILMPVNSPDPLHHSTTEWDNCTLTIEVEDDIGDSAIQVMYKDAMNGSIYAYMIQGEEQRFSRTFERKVIVNIHYLKMENNLHRVTGDQQKVLRC